MTSQPESTTPPQVIQNPRVTSVGLDNERLDVFWEFVRPEEALSYEVHVKRSRAISGPFTTVAETYNATSFTDWYVDPDAFERYWYQLEVVKRDTKETVQATRQITFESEPNLIAQEIRRRHHISHKEFTGVPILYYPLRTDGMRCPDCWSELAEQRIQSKCETCFDTGYITGFYNPILMRMNIHRDQRQLAETAETDRFAIRTATGVIPGEIPVHFGDLVIEQTNVRWAVSSDDITELLRARVSTRIRLHRVLESDIRYRVPLPRDDIFDEFERSREFTRPYTLNP